MHVAAFNISLIMRRLIGAGTPKGLSKREMAALAAASQHVMDAWRRLLALTDTLFGSGTELAVADSLSSPPAAA